MINNFIFISESVTEGHPDKLCDQISDAIVDHLLMQDPYSRVRTECAVSGAILFIATRFASTANVDFARLSRKVIKRIGYIQADFNPQTCSILSTPQALPINEKDRFSELDMEGADLDRILPKNQATVFGFACNQTPVLLPFPIWVAHKLARQLSHVRKSDVLSYLMPDGRVQVGIEYAKRKPFRIQSINIHVHQSEDQLQPAKTLLTDIRETVILPVFKEIDIQMDGKTKIAINPEGIYLGGPTHHSGLTGRKSAIDTYGEYARHSGKALSGKDPLRIDRIGAYAARYAAKNIVAAGLADECEVMLSYAAGFSKPVSSMVQTFGTGKRSDEELTLLMRKAFDFRFAAILKQLQLRYLPQKDPNGFYQKLAAYGHFGREDMNLPWEETDNVEKLKAS